MSKLNFRKPTLDDIDNIMRALKYVKHNACDYTPTNIIMWVDEYNTEIAFDDSDLYIKYNIDGMIFFGVPFVMSGIGKGIENLIKYTEDNDIELAIGDVEPEIFAIIDRIYPGQFKVNYQRDGADYVYNIKDMAELSGKKYHGKKNHINKFKKTYDNWCYEKMSDDNADECIDMVKEWCVKNVCADDESKADEICIMINSIKNREKLGLIGGLIRANDRVVAVTLGGAINDEMFDINFEKAFADIPGAYPMINQQFIINELMDYKYVNREEDMGLDGLRKAKESYLPEFMVQKGLVTFKDAK
ncbi:MAG: phosphatidylglycerol lysyltransferase domain-containing protein [Lachnospiraceae bacterium]|nr:phosphatidylglycerol lysyltransferase domain-containing protein [Lachnospiraceae bacterium]